MLRTFSGITSAQLFLANNSYHMKHMMYTSFTNYHVFYPCEEKQAEFGNF